jgi:hypothetical protein
MRVQINWASEATLRDEHGRLWNGTYFAFPLQRTAAAFLAIATRLRADSAAARAFPPFCPPRRPNATAAGFFSA